MLLSRLIPLLLALSMLAVNAAAAPIATTNNRDVLLVDATTSSEPSIAAVLSNSTDYTGGFSAADQSISALFETVGTTANAHLIVEFAGAADHNTLGIYNAAGDQIVVFYGRQDAGASTEITLFSDGSITVGRRSGEGFGGGFGFYLHNGNTGKTYYSQDGLNPNGDAHFLAYEQNDTVYFGFEDLTGYDSDYNDLIGSVQGLRGVVTHMPEPTAAMAFGVGMLILRTRLRRR